MHHDHMTFMSSLETLQSFDHFLCVVNYLIRLLVPVSLEDYVLFFILDQTLPAIVKRIGAFNP